jgi:hypothetical protein
MEQLARSSDLWTDITVRTKEGAESTFPVWLELTYGFDRTHRQMGIVIRGHRSPNASDPDRLTSEEVTHITKDRTLVYVFVSNVMTAQRLVALMGLPDTAASEVRMHLDAMAKALEPFVKEAFLGQSAEPVVATAPAADTPAAVPAPAQTQTGRAIITRDRDVSGIFRKPLGACVLEYTLFSEPRSFRAVIMVHKDGAAPKKVEFVRKDINSIIRDLNGDKLAQQIASYFGEGTRSQVYMISAVLKLGFAMNTGLARDAAGKAFAPSPSPEPTPTPKAASQETITLARMDEVQPGTFTVFNTGNYFEVPNERPEA